MSRMTCRFTGCTNGLGPTNLSGVCHMHTHAIGYCACSACSARATTVARDLPPGRRSVSVKIPGLHPGNDSEARVTMAAAPWDQEKERTT